MQVTIDSFGDFPERVPIKKIGLKDTEYDYWYYVEDKKKFFLAVIKYGIKFEEYKCGM
jgi:hypothetical protein